MIRILLRPSRLTGKFEARLDDRLLCVSKQPLLDAARILIAEGANPADTIATRHDGSPHDAMTARVGVAAKWTVRENEKDGPTFERWKASPWSAVATSMRNSDHPAAQPPDDDQIACTAL